MKKFQMIGAIRSITLPLGFLVLLPGCGGPSEQLIVEDVSGGVVSLVEFSKRGATGRYLGSLQPVKANHPIILPPEAVTRLLSGIHIGIIPPDSADNAKGIRPSPLFSASEVAMLAPAIANAFKQADPNHYVKLQIGGGAETTDGSLYIDGSVAKFTLTHYRSAARVRDERLAIYALSFIPESAQTSHAGPSNWMEDEARNPRLAIAYGQLAAGPIAQPEPHPMGNYKSAPLAPLPDLQNMKATMEKQAQELESVKGELESLKKQLGTQSPLSKPSP